MAQMQLNVDFDLLILSKENICFKESA